MINFRETYLDTRSGSKIEKKNLHIVTRPKNVVEYQSLVNNRDKYFLKIV